MPDFDPPTDPVDPIRAQIQIFRFWRSSLRQWHKCNESPLHSKDDLYPIVREHSDADSTQDNPSWMISKAAEAGLLHQFAKAGMYKLWIPERGRVIEVGGRLVFLPEQLNELLDGTPDWPFDIEDNADVSTRSVVADIALVKAPSPDSVPEVQHKSTTVSQQAPEPQTVNEDARVIMTGLSMKTSETPKGLRGLYGSIILWRNAQPTDDPNKRRMNRKLATDAINAHGSLAGGVVVQGFSRGNGPRVELEGDNVIVFNPLMFLSSVEQVHVALWNGETRSLISAEQIRQTIRDTLGYGPKQIGGVTRTLKDFRFIVKNGADTYQVTEPVMLPEIEQAASAAAPEPADNTVFADPEPEITDESPARVNDSNSLLQMSREQLRAILASLLEAARARREQLHCDIEDKRTLIEELRAKLEREQGELEDLEDKLENLETEDDLRAVRFHLQNYDIIHAGVPKLQT